MAIDINKHFGKEVEKYRIQKSLSQLELAELSKVDLRTYFNLASIRKL